MRPRRTPERELWSPELVREWDLAAHHETGHVLGALASGVTVHETTIWIDRAPRGRVAVRGRTETEQTLRGHITDAEATGHIIAILAGPEAEAVRIQQLDRCRADTARRRVYEQCRDGDLDAIRELVRCLPRHKPLPFTIDEAADLAAELVTVNWSAATAAALALQERGRLTGPELTQIAGHPQTPSYTR